MHPFLYHKLRETEWDIRVLALNRLYICINTSPFIWKLMTKTVFPVILVIVMLVIVTSTISLLQQSAYGISVGGGVDDVRRSSLGGFGGGVDDVREKAPIATSGDSIYIVWPTNRTGNDEVNFRASTDGGATFADKINLSNSTDAESQDVEIAADGDNVVITWWERNATSNEPVIRKSTDNGATFGPLLKLAANGTIGS